MPEKPYIDPEIIPSLERMQARMASRQPMTAVDPKIIRQRANAEFAPLNLHPPNLALIKDIQIEGAFGLRKARLYDALGEREDAPGLIYFHGGGWIVGDLESEDTKLRYLAIASGVRIVSYDYVLAPEHKFPQPLDDCIAAAKSIHSNAHSLGLASRQLAIGGSSAGANLALSTALKLRDEKYSWLQYMLLFYGTYDMCGKPPSRRLFNSFGGGTEAMEFFFSLYLQEKSERHNPLASPLFAEMAGLPPAFINAAGLDVLRDDSRNLVEKLQQAGIETHYEEVPGVTHGFTLLTHEVRAARKIIRTAGQALHSALA